jgi:hypothetical protein
MTSARLEPPDHWGISGKLVPFSGQHCLTLVRLGARCPMARMRFASSSDSRSNGRNCATGAPLRAMIIVSPDSTRSIISKRRALATAMPIVLFMSSSLPKLNSADKWDYDAYCAEDVAPMNRGFTRVFFAI